MMIKVTLYAFGVILGVTVTLGLETFFGVHLARNIASYTGWNKQMSSRVSTGSIPDFNVRPVPVNVYDLVDPEWMLTTPDLEQISFGSTRGKVLFMSRWATWCGPCIVEMPEIAMLQNSLPKDDVMFMLYTQEQEYTVRAFENEYDLPIYNSVGYLPDYLAVSSLPHTFIIDKRGIVQYEHSGTASWSDRRVVYFMEQLISE